MLVELGQDSLGHESLRDRMLLLRSTDSLRALDDDSLLLVAEHARTRRFRAGQALLTEGHAVDTVYVVIAGRVAVSRRGKPMAVVPRGRGVGFTSLLARDPTGVQAVAEVDTLAVEIPADVMFDAYEQDFAFVRNVLRLQATGLMARREGLPASPDHPPAVDVGTWRDGEPTLVERVIEMCRVPLFANASLDAAIEILRHGAEIRCPPGEVLWRTGEASTFSLRVDHGRVRCTNAAGRSVEIGASYMIGVMDCLSGEPRSYEARCEAPLIGYRGNFETLLAVLEAHFDLAMEFLAVLARQQLAS
jgi:CRP-like cAMP-binding protein